MHILPVPIGGPSDLQLQCFPFIGSHPEVKLVPGRVSHQHQNEGFLKGTPGAVLADIVKTSCTLTNLLCIVAPGVALYQEQEDCTC